MEPLKKSIEFILFLLFFSNLMYLCMITFVFLVKYYLRTLPFQEVVV